MAEVSFPIRNPIIRARVFANPLSVSCINAPLRIGFGKGMAYRMGCQGGHGRAVRPRALHHTGVRTEEAISAIVHEYRQANHRPSFLSNVVQICHKPRTRPIFQRSGTTCRRTLQDRHILPFIRRATRNPCEKETKPIYRCLLCPFTLARRRLRVRGLPEETLRQRFDLPASWHVLVPANSHIDKSHRLNHRAWPLAHWWELFEKLGAKNLPIVFVGAPSDRPLLEALHPLPPSTLDLIGRTDFPELIGLIQAARCVVATDTSLAHVAASVDTPVISLVGPTNPKRTAPYPAPENRDEILSAGPDYSPCYHTLALEACENNRCMQQISTSRVLMAMEKLP